MPLPLPPALECGGGPPAVEASGGGGGGAGGGTGASVAGGGGGAGAGTGLDVGFGTGVASGAEATGVEGAFGVTGAAPTPAGGATCVDPSGLGEPAAALGPSPVLSVGVAALAAPVSEEVTLTLDRATRSRSGALRLGLTATTSASATALAREGPLGSGAGSRSGKPSWAKIATRASPPAAINPMKAKTVVRIRSVQPRPAKLGRRSATRGLF